MGLLADPFSFFLTNQWNTKIDCFLYYSSSIKFVLKIRSSRFNIIIDILLIKFSIRISNINYDNRLFPMELTVFNSNILPNCADHTSIPFKITMDLI
jgi:hypothetical protein